MICGIFISIKSWIVKKEQKSKALRYVAMPCFFIDTGKKRTVEDAGPYKGMKKAYFSSFARTVSMYFFGEIPVIALKAREK